MKAPISNATKSNWQRLHTSSDGRLAKRANKTLSAKKIVAFGYSNSADAMKLLSVVSEIKAPVSDILYTLCLSKLEAFDIADAPHVQSVMREYGKYTRLNFQVPDIWQSGFHRVWRSLRIAQSCGKTCQGAFGTICSPGRFERPF